jgi:UDP-N-acetylenolpyruvoylglucosamine reductase
MKKGVAFIRGLNFYSSNRARKEEILKILKKAESEKLVILAMHKADNIIFAKKGMHHATVGKVFEALLSKHFKKKIYVTTRSIRSVKGILRKLKETKK